MFSLDNVYRIITTQLFIKKPRLSPEYRISLFMQILPQELKLLFPAFLNDASSSFDKNNFRLLAERMPQGSNFLQAVFLSLRANPKYMEALYKSCAGFLENNKNNINQNRFLAATRDWIVRTKLKEGDPLMIYLEQADDTMPIYSKHLTWMIISCFCDSKDSLYLLYDAYNKQPSKKAGTPLAVKNLVAKLNRCCKYIENLNEFGPAVRYKQIGGFFKKTVEEPVLRIALLSDKERKAFINDFCFEITDRRAVLKQNYEANKNDIPKDVQDFFDSFFIKFENFIRDMLKSDGNLTSMPPFFTAMKDTIKQIEEKLPE